MDHYTCQRCGRKQSKRKGQEISVAVHHKNEIEWELIIDEVYKRILTEPEYLETLCVECHDKEHA